MYTANSRLSDTSTEQSVLYVLPSGVKPDAHLKAFKFWYKLPPRMRRALDKYDGCLTIIGLVELKYNPENPSMLLLVKRLALLPNLGRTTALQGVRELREAGFIGEMFADR